MFNVDTMELGMNLEDRQKEIETILGRKKTITDYNYVKSVDSKIKEKLYIDTENTKKLKMLIDMKNTARKIYPFSTRNEFDIKIDIFRFGKDGGYGFCYNQTRHTLTIKLQHWLIEQFTAEEIIANTEQELMKFFGLTTEEINPLTLRRIDYYCDYKFRDDTELEIIKNIISKLPDQFYSYRKEITDEPEKYVVKYLALKGKGHKYEDTKFNISKKAIIDKEEDDEDET